MSFRAYFTMSRKSAKPAAPKRSRTMTETVAEGHAALARNPPEEPIPSLLRTKTSAETAADAAKFLKRQKKAAAAKGSLLVTISLLVDFD